MTILATPQYSQVLLINPVLLDSGCYLSNQRPDLVTQTFERLSKAANKLYVPRYFAVSDVTGDRTTWFAKPCEARKQRVFLCPADQPVLSNGDLVEAMKAEDRMQLFICGFWLDDAVTATALEALTLGFDVRVITDLSFALNDDARDLAMNRFNQYTVAPMSLANLLYEWTTKAENEETRLALHQIWQDHLNSNALS